LQKTQPRNWAGFQRAAHTATIAGLPLGGLCRGIAVEMDDLFAHAGILNQDCYS
jgi:hypothetical protein